MEREEFVRKLSVLLDVLPSCNDDNDLRIVGDSNTKDSLSFFVRKDELYSYNVQLWIGERDVASVLKVSKDDILFMFTDYTASKIRELYILPD